MTTATVLTQKTSQSVPDADATKSLGIVRVCLATCRLWSVGGRCGSTVVCRQCERRERTKARITPGRIMPPSRGVTMSSTAMGTGVSLHIYHALVRVWVKSDYALPSTRLNTTKTFTVPASATVSPSNHNNC